MTEWIGDPVYQGFWIDWSKGRLMGVTLTLANRKAGYLVAFLALFVHIAGSSFWRLSSFLLFRMRGRVDSKATLQKQVILRNGSSAITALKTLLGIMLNSKQKREHLALTCWALVNFVSFLAAGILSSKVVGEQSDVLLQPTNCGRMWSFSFGGSQMSTLKDMHGKDVALLTSNLYDLRRTSSQYEAVCYNGANAEQDCFWFARRPITGLNQWKSNCPFDESICRGNVSLWMDTGWLKSDLDFGINSYPEDRVTMRVQQRCAPLNRDKYVKTYDANNITSIIAPGELGSPVREALTVSAPYSRYEAFFYGANPRTDATFIYNNATRQTSYGLLGSVPQSYSLDVAQYQPCFGDMKAECTSTFDPVPELRSSQNHDITIIFVSSDIEYCGPVHDPIFQALDCTVDNSTGVEHLGPCRPSHTTTAIGCAGENQLCVGNSDADRRCARISANGYPFAGDNISQESITTLLDLNPRQAAIAARLQDAIYRSSSAAMIEDMGGQNMLAYNAVGSVGCSPPLPNQQWIAELEQWFAAALVNMQLYNTEFVTGWEESSIDKYVTPPPESDRWMCHAQVVQRTSFASFSVMGMITIFVIGGVFIVLDVCVPRLVARLNRSTADEHRSSTSWESLGLLEMADEIFEDEQCAEDNETACDRSSQRSSHELGTPTKTAVVETIIEKSEVKL